MPGKANSSKYFFSLKNGSKNILISAESLRSGPWRACIEASKYKHLSIMYSTDCGFSKALLQRPHSPEYNKMQLSAKETDLVNNHNVYRVCDVNEFYAEFCSFSEGNSNNCSSRMTGWFPFTFELEPAASLNSLNPP